MSTKTIRCPVDGRQFATQAALRQHNLASHAQGSSPKPKPMTGAGSRKGLARRVKANNNFNGQNFMASGSDLIGTVTLKDSLAVGAVLLLWDVNPATLSETRLARMSQVFTRWRPRKLQVTIVPGAGVLTPGSYAVGWTADQRFEIGSAENRVQRIMTLKPNILGVFGTPKILSIPCDTTQKWYLCDPNMGAESDHGAVVCVLAGKLGGNNISINFRLEWTIEFNSPDIPATIEDLEIYPDPDYIPIFTDSVSDWASGKKLTFKHKEGGSVVPWIGIKERVIYKPTKGVTIPYNNGTEEKNCEFFAKIVGSELYTSALACFADEAKAKAYITTGDVSNVLDFKAAGSYCTPSLPTLKGVSVSDLPLLDLRHSAKPMKPKAQTAMTYNYQRSATNDSSLNISRAAPGISSTNIAVAGYTSNYLHGRSNRDGCSVDIRPANYSDDESSFEQIPEN